MGALGSDRKKIVHFANRCGPIAVHPRNRLNPVDLYFGISKDGANILIVQVFRQKNPPECQYRGIRESSIYYESDVNGTTPPVIPL